MADLQKKRQDLETDTLLETQPDAFEFPDKNLQDEVIQEKDYGFKTLGEPSEAREEAFWESVGLAVCPKLSWT